MSASAAVNLGRKGTGLRSSLSGITATVFGARGFLGTFTTSELGKIGTQINLPHHGCEMEMRHCKVMGDYGQIAIMPFHARDKDSIRQAVEGSDIVINIIGKHHATRHLHPGIINWSLDEVHVEAASNIAEVSKEMGVERFVHVSALAQDENSESEWAASKAKGEKAVKSFYEDATIVRPGWMFGPEDRFLCLYAKMAGMLPFCPVIDDGEALYEPVYVHDVAKAIKNIVLDPTTAGQTYEFVGPDQYTQNDIADYVLEQTGRKNMDGYKRFAMPVPQGIAASMCKPFEYTPFDAPVTADLTKLVTLDSVASGTCPGLSDLGVEATPMEDLGSDILLRFRAGGHFNDVEGYHNFEDPAPDAKRSF